MTRADLVAKLSLRLNISKTEADKYVLLILGGIMSHLETERRVVVQGFGSFHLKEYKARVAKKPLTGEIINLPVRRKPVFHAGKELKAIINQGPKNIWREKMAPAHAATTV